MKANPTMWAEFPPAAKAQPDYLMGLWMCFVIVALTLLAASTTYRYIEVPARSYLNKRFKPSEFEPVKVVN
jgi:peptidoglycan/LPS O-acetylase OafA/YrhL